MKRIARSEEFETAVHKALQLWSKDPALGSPLQSLALVQRERIVKGINIRRATNQVLLAALTTMSVDHPKDVSLLRARFLDGKPVTIVANENNVAEVTLFKMQHRAIELLTSTLLDMERRLAVDDLHRLTARVPPATYDCLFGVENHLNHLDEVLLEADGAWGVCIEGLGGIGKTAMAHQLVLRLARQQAFVDFGWVSAQHQSLQIGEGLKQNPRSATTTQAVIEQLAVQLLPREQIPAPLTAERALNALDAHLHQAPLLIAIDNLETLTDVESLLPTLFRLAGPSKFLLTSRETPHTQAGIYHFTVPELTEADALSLVRHEARLRQLPHVADAPANDLRPIYTVVGGNPLALRLVVGQLHVLPLTQVLENLRQAKGKRAEELYFFIYWYAWRQLPPIVQRVLMLMPLFAHDGADLAAILRAGDLEEDVLVEALAYLVKLSLVNVGGDLETRRYAIHRLTESFLLNEVIKWGGAQDHQYDCTPSL